MYILLLVILGFILWPLIKGLWTVVRQVHRMRSFMNDPAAYMRREAERQRRQRRAGGDERADTTTTRRSKKIAPDVGEYVEYTEINESWESTAGERVEYHESQITDIEWEDIR